MGVSPAATEPHLSPQEPGSLLTPHSASFPRGARGLRYLGHWPHGKPLWRSPPSRYPGCRQTRGRVPATAGGSTTWGSAWAQGRPPGRLSVLGPLASCCPSPQLRPPRAPHPPHLGSRRLLGTGPALASQPYLCVCARVTSGHADEGGHRPPGGHPSGPRGSSSRLRERPGPHLLNVREAPVGEGPTPDSGARLSIPGRSLPALRPPAGSERSLFQVTRAQPPHRGADADKGPLSSLTI